MADDDRQSSERPRWRIGEPWRPEDGDDQPSPAPQAPPPSSVPRIERPPPPRQDPPPRPPTIVDRLPPERSPLDATVLMPAVDPPPSRPTSAPPPRRSEARSPASPPQPPVTTPPVRRPPPPRRRRRNPLATFLRRLGLLLLILLVILVAVSVWAGAQIERVPVPSLAGSGPGPDTVLIVGSDSRENLPDDLEGSFGDFAGSRADVIILAQVADGRVRLLSLPRDLRVAIPGEGTNKINAAYAFGGPDLLVRTIQEDIGIPIAHYAEVDFGGFASIVDAVGGVELDFEYPTRDQKSGLLVEEPGTQLVDGATALAYVRSRSTEELRDGEWRSGAGGDIERTGRQREVLSGIADSATSLGAIPRLPALIVAVGDSVVVSEESQTLPLAWFGWRFLTAGETDSIPLPVTGSSEGGVSYVVRTEQAASVISDFVDGEPIEAPE